MRVLSVKSIDPSIEKLSFELDGGAGEKLALAAIHAAQNPDLEPLQYIDQPKCY